MPEFKWESMLSQGYIWNSCRGHLRLDAHPVLRENALAIVDRLCLPSACTVP